MLQGHCAVYYAAVQNYENGTDNDMITSALMFI